MKASDFVAKYLELRGVKVVFELSGGMITHLLDSISQKTKINIISMHHEQAAAFAADGYGRVTGVPGVALATSGPGATNLLTGIASCFFDSSPAVFITGQVNRHEQKGERPIRQLGFQETDIVAMARPVTKACFKVSDASEFPFILKSAFDIALEGRCGPVLIDIPMDLQRAEIDETFLGEGTPSSAKRISERAITELIAAIKQSKKPVILAGRGIRASFSDVQFIEFAEKVQIPVVTSLLALDVIPFEHELRVGFIGSYGNRWANMALGAADLVVVIGSRLDIRQTGADTLFFGKRIIYHIDCEEGEINNRIKGCNPIVGDIRDFLDLFKTTAEKEIFASRDGWIHQIRDLKDKWPDTRELDAKGINPNKFIHQLSRASRTVKVYLADVGSHQMWVAQSLEITKGQLFLTSGGMGAMGFSLPAAIGACLALEKCPTLLIAGDGCMQINIQELQTIVRNELPIKIIVMNNQNLGMIRQFQDSYFDSRYQSTFWGYNAPDFEKIGNAYGVDSRTISGEDEIDEAVKWLWKPGNDQKPLLLQVMIDPYTNTYPKIAFGKPITEMEPFSKPIDMEGT